MKLSHLVDAEYGNQGIDFKMVPREGFGWMNGTFHLALCFFFPGPGSRVTFSDFFCCFVPAAYQVGLSFMTTHMRRALAACTSPEVFFGAAANLEQALPNANLPSTDPLGLAMEALSVSVKA